MGPDRIMNQYKRLRYARSRSEIKSILEDLSETDVKEIITMMLVSLHESCKDGGFDGRK